MSLKIENETEHLAALQRVVELMKLGEGGKKTLSPEELAELDMLVDMVDQYEAEHYPMGKNAEAEEEVQAVEGGCSKALCEYCDSIVATRFSRRDITFSDGSGLVKDLLVGVCAECDSTVSIPAVSLPAILDAVGKRVYERELYLDGMTDPQ